MVRGYLKLAIKTTSKPKDDMMQRTQEIDCKNGKIRNKRENVKK